MRVAVITDIHGNLHALEAVLTAIDDERVDVIWCLGDLVGYGPRPNPCCELVAARAALCLSGNHDLGVLGRITLDEFSQDAATAARWTARILEERWRTYLEGLLPVMEADGATLAHGSPRDPIWEYVLGRDSALAAIEDASQPIVLVGHSHVALAFSKKDGEVAGGPAPEGTEIELGGGTRWLVNPGSVGQPRDGDPRAAWLVLDFEAGKGSFRRTPYPIEVTQREITERNLPPILGARLQAGL